MALPGAFLFLGLLTVMLVFVPKLVMMALGAVVLLLTFWRRI